jgi:hypothetical protein
MKALRTGAGGRRMKTRVLQWATLACRILDDCSATVMRGAIKGLVPPAKPR